jgi:hypothetical protein
MPDTPIFQQPETYVRRTLIHVIALTHRMRPSASLSGGRAGNPAGNPSEGSPEVRAED